MAVNKHNRRLKIEENSVYTFLFSILWCLSTVLVYVRGMVYTSESFLLLYNIFLFTCIGICSLILLPRLGKRIGLGNILLIMFMVFSFALSYWFGRSIELIKENSGAFFFTVLPFYFLGVCMPTNEESLNSLFVRLYKVAIVSIFVVCIYKVYFLYSGRILDEDAMGDSYRLLPSTLLVTYIMFKKQTKVNTVAFILSICYLLLMGTRGAILIEAGWFIVCYIKKLRVSNIYPVKLTIIILLICGFSLLVVTGVFENIVVLLEKALIAKGLPTRIFSFMLDKSLMNDSGRKEIVQKPIWDALNQNGFIPSGLYADRLVVKGYYAHNVVLELLYDYGYLIGSIVIISLVVLLVRAYRKTINETEHYMFCMFLWLVVVKLFVSSSFLLEPYFFFLLGYSSIIARRKVGLTDFY